MGREFTKVGVVGFGTMGVGITEVVARKGIDVVAVDIVESAFERGKAALAASTARAVKGGKLTEEERSTTLDRVTYSLDLAAVKDCQLVLESIPESLELKKSVFGQLDQIVAADAILATNTSSLSVTEIAVSAKSPSRVVGMHFFNPAPILDFVEIVRTVITSDDVFSDAKALCERLGKAPVVVGDKAGFIANTLYFGYLNHAVSLYENKYASREDVDAAMRFGCGYPMGPLALMDLIGLDTAYEILDTMYHQDRDRLHAPSPIIKQMISAGLRGRKTGRGFYTYAEPGSAEVVPDRETPDLAAQAAAKSRPIETVGVVGSGTMATGIVEVFAKAGFPVTYVARGADKVAGVSAAIAKSMGKSVERGRMTQEDADAVLGRLTGSTSREDLADVDIVVEAIAEELEIKQDLFRDLDKICKPGAILATTTSSLPVIECGNVTSRIQDVIGMHFFNPAPVMRLVEIVHTVATADDVINTTVNLTRKIGKHPVQCADRSGFIVNALLFPYLNDAVKMLDSHYATVDEIDIAMKTGCRLPMGPFELLDVVGLDVSLAIQKELYLEFRHGGFAPSPLLEHMVTAGYLGRKTKRGFRVY
ncbi:MAG: 3-hydroxyacyl-CoA dehydrogenase family protein [Dermatophilaceae bacterium]